MNDEVVSYRERHLRALYLAIGFFTRLPTKFLDVIEDQDMGRTLAYLPVVGLIVGILTAGSGVLLSSFLSEWHGTLTVVHLSLIGLVAFAVLVFASGGLHLDGLADCADAWIGGLGDRERTLTIMKDPLCGAMAVTVVIVTLVTKVGAIMGLVVSGNWMPVLLIPVLSRSSGLALFLTTDYVRPKGLGQAFSDFCNNPRYRTECRVALAAGIGIPAFLMASAWPALVLSALAWLWLQRQSKERLGGITGDVCGAVIELIEAVLFISIALFI